MATDKFVFRTSIPAGSWRSYNMGVPYPFGLGTLEDYSRLPMTLETWAKRYAATLDDFAAESELFGTDDFDGLAAS